MADPRRGFGQPVFVRGGACLEDVLGTFHAGKNFDAFAREFGIPPDELGDAVPVASTQSLAA